jgi:hypothetical protein
VTAGGVFGGGEEVYLIPPKEDLKTEKRVEGKTSLEY